MIELKAAEKWRDQCESCEDEVPEGLKVLVLSSSKGEAYRGLSICLCRSCRAGLRAVLRQGEIDEKKRRFSMVPLALCSFCNMKAFTCHNDLYYCEEHWQCFEIIGKEYSRRGLGLSPTAAMLANHELRKIS